MIMTKPLSNQDHILILNPDITNNIVLVNKSCTKEVISPKTFQELLSTDGYFQNVGLKRKGKKGSHLGKLLIAQGLKFVFLTFGM